MIDNGSIEEDDKDNELTTKKSIEDNKSSVSKSCLICMGHTDEHHIIIPCMHIIKIHMLCKEKYKDKSCPICRTDIDKFQKAFLVE